MGADEANDGERWCSPCVYCGGGATGVELAAEWAKVSKQLNRYQNDTQLSITLIEAADRVLPASADCMSEKYSRNCKSRELTSA